MSEELSKRLDDLHKRFDDLRGDMNQRFSETNHTLRTFMWVVSGWFTFLTAVLAVFGFLRR